MNCPAASYGVSEVWIAEYAASGGESDPKGLNKIIGLCTAARISVHADRIRDHRILGEQIHFKAIGDSERLQLFLHIGFGDLPGN
jgi:hypothetical protein